jgi:hypothetical protein
MQLSLPPRLRWCTFAPTACLGVGACALHVLAVYQNVKNVLLGALLACVEWCTSKPGA